MVEAAPRGIPDLDDSGWDTLEALGRAFHVRDASLSATLGAILSTAKELVPGTDFAGINLLLSGHVFEPQAIVGEPPHQLDTLQQQTGVGPCIDASRSQQVIRVENIATCDRWPEYTALASALGVGSILCTPMWVDQLRLGSISLFSCSAHAFGAGVERVTALLAAHASVALAEAQRRENLTIALRNRDVIGQAKGILMERHRITADAAFDLLSGISQRTNRKLVAVAEAVTTTGALPD